MSTRKTSAKWRGRLPPGITRTRAVRARARSSSCCARTPASAKRKDVSTFVDALIFNWLIAGTDAHAKNYSLLIGTGGRVRLAPLYDLASALPYDHMDFRKLRLAMKIGRSYRLRDVGGWAWRRFAGDVRLDPDAVLHRIECLTEQMPDHAAAVREETASQGLKHRVIERLCSSLTERAMACRKAEGGGP